MLYKIFLWQLGYDLVNHVSAVDEEVVGEEYGHQKLCKAYRQVGEETGDAVLEDGEHPGHHSQGEIA
ncbi:Uncharacterised protein [uncultured archaeon]|nr:Uncharacterised protein [uncultured archaeon]